MTREEVRVKLAVMKQVAKSKVCSAHGSDLFWRQVEFMLEQIATARVAEMAPVNENLLGLAMMLLEEVKRLKGTDHEHLHVASMP